MGRKIKFMFQF